MINLIDKYNIPAPRYTSYPTVPYWQKEAPNPYEWMANIRTRFLTDQHISLYIHLPYCERLCTYCGCNKRITKNHLVELPYLKSVLKEWQLYLDLFPSPPIIKEIHLGGGTPTFFQPQNLAYLIKGILEKAQLSEDFEFGFEAHPANTTFDHLVTLRRLGFRRLSIGIQDFSTKILNLINRPQTEEQVFQLVQSARSLGYRSINFDLIYGLPKQQLADIRYTMEKVKALRPERIAFYSYAHVPWIKPSQRAYSEADLPVGVEKQALYELGKALLKEQGYQDIGMDHFSLACDGLHQALSNGQLHRNFMGYTPHYTALSIALGASAISDSWTAYVQNEKSVERYQERVEQGEFPFFRGHLLNFPDLVIRHHILNLMCRYQTDWSSAHYQSRELFIGLDRLKEFEKDGLIRITNNQLIVLPAGKPFIRNICMALDGYHWKRKQRKRVFSKAI